MTSARDKRKARPFGDESGAAAVEFALIVPIAIALMVITADLGMAGYVKARVENAAEAGAAFAQNYGWNKWGIILAAQHSSNLPGLAVDTTATCDCVEGGEIVEVPCHSTCPNGLNPGIFIRVSASAVYTPTLPYPGIERAITLGASSIVRVN